jgi:hypothetical protein
MMYLRHAFMSVLFFLTFTLQGQPRVMRSAEGRTVIPEVITFFIEREEKLPQGEKQDIIRRITEPGHTNRLFIEDQLRRETVQGIYSLYHGWCTYSDYNGQITFPKKHIGDRVTFVISRALQPIFLQEALIHHFRVDPDEPAAYYHLDFALHGW